MPISIAEFVEKWKSVALTERSASQSHFIQLCDLLGHPDPVTADPTGTTFTFEKHVSTLLGGKGFADVWKKGYFGWEYKGKHKNLVEAYKQLADYREDLENPPLLVVCDMDIFEVHTNFVRTRPNVYRFTLEELAAGVPTANCALAPIEVLRAVFTDPDKLSPGQAAARVTEQAAEEFSKLATSLQSRQIPPEQAAHFLMRVLFCLFADSIGLLPDHVFRQLIEKNRDNPQGFARKLRQLFAAMSTSGNNFGVEDIHWFNGGLFADDAVFDLTFSDLGTLRKAAALDWSTIEPSIFGTLFERSLNPDKRSQLGAHYTSPEDILLIIEPVVMAPLERRWQQVKAEAETLATKAEQVKGTAKSKLRRQLQDKLSGWAEELSKVRILDPACGSGNFLYLALRRMLDLWKEAHLFLAAHGLPAILPFQVNPAQLYGIEMNVYAHELASVVVWIGYLQWLHDNNMGLPTEPILRKLDNIKHDDAILTSDSQGQKVEPEWPDAEFIIGNPPFLGGSRMRNELGDEYVESLRALYDGRVPGGADMVTYWFEKSRAQIEAGRAKRVGLLATNSITMVGNRPVLERILRTGEIFMAWSDRPWVLDGAAVRVSILGFDDGSESTKTLDGQPVEVINSDLTTGVNVTTAVKLAENRGLSFKGVTLQGPFDLTTAQAEEMLAAPVNPNGRPNSDVVKRTLNGRDVVQRSAGGWLIDFGERPEVEAAFYELPFEYVQRYVRPIRERNNRERTRRLWWLHGENRPGLRAALTGLNRYIATPGVARHRIFVWLSTDIIPDQKLCVFPREDDYFFGVLHSRVHEAWSLATCGWIGAGNDISYTAGTTFETFPFPWPPGQEPADEPLVKDIANAALELVEARDAWLNPEGASAGELEERTLTNLYNANPTWLANAHRKLDEAVCAAYSWPTDISKAEILVRLLALNRERSGPDAATPETTTEEPPDSDSE